MALEQDVLLAVAASDEPKLLLHNIEGNKFEPFECNIKEFEYAYVASLFTQFIATRCNHYHETVSITPTNFYSPIYTPICLLYLLIGY